MIYPKPKDLDATIFIDGQYCIWDNDSKEDFGQIWMPVCVWCKGGPLTQSEGLTCEDCRPKHIQIILDDLTSVWRAVRPLLYVNDEL